MWKTMRAEVFIVTVLSSLLVWYSEAATQSMPGRLCLDEDDGSPPHCYYAFYQAVTKDKAVANCASFGAKLILPKHYDENYDLADFMFANGMQRSWIDATENPLTWEEVTGTLQPWAPSKPDRSAEYSACVLLPHAEDFMWDHAECSSKHGFVCERAGTANDCSANNQFTIGSSCYTYNAQALVTWFEASSACEEIGSYLAVMQDSEAFFLSVNFLAKSENAEFWVGHTNRVWKDSNDVPLQFYNWDEGQPDQNVQKCGVLLDDGLWMDRNCTFEFPYICELDCPSGVNGTQTCLEKEDGDYQSCYVCDGYNSCSGGAISLNRECAQPGQVWDDESKRCALSSSTCDLPIDVVTTQEPPQPTDAEKQTSSDSGSNTLLIERSTVISTIGDGQLSDLTTSEQTSVAVPTPGQESDISSPPDDLTTVTDAVVTSQSPDGDTSPRPRGPETTTANQDIETTVTENDKTETAINTKDRTTVKDSNLGTKVTDTNPTVQRTTFNPPGYEVPTASENAAACSDHTHGHSTALIGLGVSAAVLIILAVAIGLGVYYTRRKHAQSSSSMDGRRKLTDDNCSMISNESHPDFAKATKYSHETFLDSDATPGERFWTWRDAGPKNSRV